MANNQVNVSTLINRPYCLVNGLMQLLDKRLKMHLEYIMKEE